MNNALWMILSLSVSGSLIAVLLLLLKPVLKDKVSKAFSYYIWLIVLVRLVLPISAPVNMIDSLVQSVPAHEQEVYAEQAAEEQFFAEEDVAHPVVFEPETQQTEDNAEMPLFNNETITTENTVHSISFWERCIDVWSWITDHLVVIWGLGALVMLVWFIVGYLRFAEHLNRFSSAASAEDEAVFRKLAGKSRVRMLYNSAISTPILIGVLNPQILVPEHEYVKNGQREQLEGLLKHELTHYRRKDLLYKWAAVIVSALHWFNPLMIVIRKEISSACELACDEAVIRGMTAEQKQVYGETLLSFAVRRKLPAGIVATTFGERKSDLKTRLVSIMQYRKKPLWIAVLCVILAFALAGCAVLTGVTTGKQEKSTVETATGNKESEESVVIAEATSEKKNTEESGESDESQEIAETGQNPRRYYDVNGDGESDVFVELTMTYDETVKTLKELEAQKIGKITKEGINSAVAARDTDARWLIFEENLDNGVLSTSFWFNEENMLSGVVWQDLLLNEEEMQRYLYNCIEAEGIPIYRKDGAMDAFFFRKGEGYLIQRHHYDVRGEGAVSWNLVLKDSADELLNEFADRVYRIEADSELVKLLPKDAIGPQAAMEIACEKLSINEKAISHAGYAIYEGAYYYVLRTGSIVKEGESPSCCYVSMDGKSVMKGTYDSIEMILNQPTVTDTKYLSDNTTITMMEYRKNDTSYYVGDIYIRDIGQFRTAFSNDDPANNRQHVYEQAQANDAIIAITGDNQQWQKEGLMIRNGEVYRDTLSDCDICVLYKDGTMKTYSPEEAKAQKAEILSAEPWQSWSWGPMLLKEGQPLTEFNTRVAAKNPRAAIGYYEPGHYCFVVADGRSEDSAGMTMQELSQLMYELGCSEAYNLDGGNSAAMALYGETCNQPANGGRGVCDILYISETEEAWMNAIGIEQLVIPFP